MTRNFSDGSAVGGSGIGPRINDDESTFASTLKEIRALREDQAWALAYQVGTFLSGGDPDVDSRLIREALNLLWEDRQQRILALGTGTFDKATA